jgi:hypothetical protein
MNAWPKGEEEVFRAAPHRHTFNEKLMAQEIDMLRRKLLAVEMAVTAHDAWDVRVANVLVALKG